MLANMLLNKTLRQWELVRQTRSRDNKRLRVRLRELFFQKALTDDIILKRLREEDFIINKRRLQEIRKEESLSPECVKTCNDVMMRGCSQFISVGFCLAIIGT